MLKTSLKNILQANVSVLFSEPKIPQSPKNRKSVLNEKEFQCSSASRKFLNTLVMPLVLVPADVSVLFSEPKIPQCGGGEVLQSGIVGSFSALQRAENSSICVVRHRPQRRRRVSVLFSEPKIPQSAVGAGRVGRGSVSVLFSEPKIPQSYRRLRIENERIVSVLFSEPKIPQSLKDRTSV